MPRCRARDLSILVHGRDPRHGRQKKKKKRKISGLFTVCVREREYGLCVYIRACLTYHKTRQTMALLWLFSPLPWHLTRIAEFQITIYELLLVGPVAFINIRSPAM